MRAGDEARGPSIEGTAAMTGGGPRDPALARAAGMRAPVVVNLVHFARLTELMLDLFGPRWHEHGAIEVRYRAPLHAGDTLTPIARVAVVEPLPGGERRVALEVRCENQDGVVLATGTASCTLAADGDDGAGS